MKVKDPNRSTEKKQLTATNYLTGSVGAFLGTLIGVACIVVINQLGYVASISGLIMAICAIKGFTLLSGGINKIGVAITSVLIIAMTFFAYHLNLAIALQQELSAQYPVDISIFESFRLSWNLLVAGYLDTPVYIGELVMLYLFTLLGSVPTILAELKKGAQPFAPTTEPLNHGEITVQSNNIQFYTPQRKWLRSVRVSVILATYPILILSMGIMVVILVFLFNQPERIMDLSGVDAAMVGFGTFGLVSSLIAMIAMLPFILRINQAGRFCFIRLENGALYQVDLYMLNMIEAYRFTKIVRLYELSQDKLKDHEWAAAQDAITRAIAAVESGQFIKGSPLSKAIFPMKGRELLKETAWYWKMRCGTIDGAARTVYIPKIYPELSLTPELGASQGPLPLQISLIATVLSILLASGIIGAVIFYLAL